MSSPSPLQRYLQAQSVTDSDLRRILRGAVKEADARLVSLAGREGIGAQVRRAQYATILRNLNSLQNEMWGEANQAVRRGIVTSAARAADAEKAVNRVLFEALGGPVPALEAAMEAQAKQTAQNLFSKAANDIPLSQQVYRTRAFSDGLVNRAVNRGILLGQSWKELANSVTGMINPDTPGGVSYAANRLGRSELNNAFHRTQIEQRKEDPFVDGMQWHLSRTHPKADDCDDLANSSHFRGGNPGVFKPEEVPRKPHPQCLCFVTSVPVSRQQFIDGFLDGEYDKYIDDKVYRFAPERAPCG